MKMLLFVILSAVAGVAIGLGAAFARYRLPGDADPLSDGSAAQVMENPPKVAVDQETFDLGDAIAGERLEHTFVFSNQGTGTLFLHHNPETDSTCKCTVGAIDDGEIGPGEQTEVTLTITIEGDTGPFRQQAVIHTNDPQRRRVTLMVTGEITRPISPSVRELVIGHVAAKEGGSAKFRIYAFHGNDLEILGHRFDPGTGKLFNASFAPLPPEALEDEKELGVKAGWEATVSLKPGLPLGPFQQTIRVRTKSSDVETELEVPIRGSIVSDFYISGFGWDPDHEVLHLGRIKGREGKKRTVYLLVRGPYRNDVRVTSASAVPDALHVTAGDPISSGDEKLVRIPLHLEVPPGTPSLNFQGENLGGYGKIVLETTHPEVKQLEILVSLVVEG